LLDPLNIILLAAAAFVVWRLFGVLGQRTGNEGTGFDPFAKPSPAPVKDSDSRPDTRSDPAQAAKPVWEGVTQEGTDLARSLEDIAKSDPSFNVPQFLGGAKLAYEMILEAYAKGDKPTLKPLLAREVMDEFSAAIDDRMAAGHTAFLQFVGVKNASVEHAALVGKRAQVTVAFLSEMISATVDRNGETVDGDQKGIRDIADRWTFERDVSSRDPNWRLIDTTADAA
jgi:predicted lipid-binding transport protein (Tim44 family)